MFFDRYSLIFRTQSPYIQRSPQARPLEAAVPSDHGQGPAPDEPDSVAAAAAFPQPPSNLQLPPMGPDSFIKPPPGHAAADNSRSRPTTPKAPVRRDTARSR